MKDSNIIYCISGLGADEKVFEKISIPNYTLQHLEWLTPLKNENIQSYAGRMAKQIGQPLPVILGLSFGGLLAVEIAKQIAVQKVILVSAVKTNKELPAWMRLTGKLRLHKIFPVRSNRFTEKADDRRMGVQTEAEKELVSYYRKNADNKYLAWAIDQVLNWKNKRIPKSVYHIHGDEDKMFPIKNIVATHVIKGGSHIMILNKPEEISRCIVQIVGDF